MSPPCSTEERHQHAAVIFRGDAFRLAACAVRSAPKAAGHPAYQSDSDIALDVQWQLRIYQSYVDNFEKPLRSLNYVVDYFSVQYPTPHDLEVLRFFGPRLKSWIRLNSGTQGVSAVVGLLALQQHCERQDYDFVMLTRHDVQLTRSSWRSRLQPHHTAQVSNPSTGKPDHISLLDTICIRATTGSTAGVHCMSRYLDHWAL